MQRKASIERSAYAQYEITKCKSSGATLNTCDEIPIEHVLTVYLNNAKVMDIACTPSFLVELVLGRLISEGLIADIADIESVSLSEDSSQVKICLRKMAPAHSGETWRTITTYGSKGIPAAWIDQRSPLRDVTPIPWNADEVFSLARDFASDTPIHRATCGSHSCRLAAGGKLLYCCEDLGRHNAFDKALGCAVRDEINLSTATLFTSGRIPVDMVEKAIRARVPILVSKAVPTNRTVELARKYGLTLICSARPDSLKVFSDPLGCMYTIATA